MLLQNRHELLSSPRPAWSGPRPRQRAEGKLTISEMPQNAHGANGDFGKVRAILEHPEDLGTPGHCTPDLVGGALAGDRQKTGASRRYLKTSCPSRKLQARQGAGHLENLGTPGHRTPDLVGPEIGTKGAVRHYQKSLCPARKSQARRAARHPENLVTRPPHARPRRWPWRPWHTRPPHAAHALVVPL